MQDSSKAPTGKVHPNKGGKQLERERRRGWTRGEASTGECSSPSWPKSINEDEMERMIEGVQNEEKKREVGPTKREKRQSLNNPGRRYWPELRFPGFGGER